MRTQSAFFAFLGVLYTASAFTIGPFNDFVQQGVADQWNASDPENVRGGNFAAKAGAGKLWLVSRRLHRTDDGPWDAASRGGIVSTLPLDTKTWSHKPYDRLAVDQNGEITFVAADRLHMLTYSVAQRSKVAFEKLFAWDDAAQRWVEVPLTLELTPEVLLQFSPTIYAIDAVVPQGNGSVVYVATSSHVYAQRGSVINFFKIDIQTSPASTAVLKQLARKVGDEPSAVKAMAVKNDKLIAFVANFYSEGYVPEYAKAYALDLASNEVSEVQTSGSRPIVDAYTDVNFFQTGEAAFVAGGSYTYGLGNTATSNKVWSLDLNTMQWSESPNELPANVGKLAFEQTERKLYSVSLDSGVKEASVTV